MAHKVPRRGPRQTVYPEDRYDIFPAPGGLLPFATTDCGNILAWETRGEPERWPIIFLDARGPYVEVHAVPLSDLIAGFADGSLTSELISTDLGDWKVFMPFARCSSNVTDAVDVRCEALRPASPPLELRLLVRPLRQPNADDPQPWHAA